MNFAIINRQDAAKYQDHLTIMVDFALLQDTSEDNVYKLLGVTQDDVLLYGADGKLAAMLPSEGSVTTDLGTQQGRDNLMGLALALAALP